MLHQHKDLKTPPVPAQLRVVARFIYYQIDTLRQTFSLCCSTKGPRNKSNFEWLQKDVETSLKINFLRYSENKLHDSDEDSKSNNGF